MTCKKRLRSLRQRVVALSPDSPKGLTFSIRQREHIQSRRGLRRWLDVGLSDQAVCHSASAGHDCDILAAIHRIRDGAVLNAAGKRGFPDDLSAVGVHSPEPLGKIAVE